MKIVSDLHIHSRFSRACSKSINIANLEKYARIKGVSLLGTGDFTHPLWLKELKGDLSDDGSGVLKTKTGFPFVLQVELSNIYKQDNQQRRVHNVILAPSFEVVDQITEALLKRGRLDYDGRPIFGFSCVELVEMMVGISSDIEIIPAHAWTPWYSMFGSKSGFDSIQKCFGDQTKHIHAIETGLSSNPAMNWRLSQLDNINLVSFSDSHSYWPWRMGREATVFDVNELNYENIIKAVRTGEDLVETIEVDPAYGKYHWDGHRACNVSLSPSESIKNKDMCPVCGRSLTIGVEHRIEELADRPEGFRPENAKPFKSLIPLSEIISSIIGVNQPYSQRVWEYHNKLIKILGSEFTVLLESQKEKISELVGEKIADAIIKVREGKATIKPGYDGVYGELIFNGESKRKETPGVMDKQKSLTDFGK